MPTITTTFHPTTKTEWREWLHTHHTTATEIWIILFKKSSGKQTLTYPELVDEALCYGWIDSVEKSLDAERYAIRLTPRKAHSHWSNINQKRYQELLAQGLVTAAGKAAYELPGHH